MKEKLKGKLNYTIVLFTMVYLVALGIVVPKAENKSRIDIALVSLSDPFRINRFTHLKVYIENNEPRQLRPVFSIITGEKHEKKGFWNIISGPTKLLPGEGHIFVLETEISSYSIPPGTYFRIQVNDGGYPNFMAVSKTFGASVLDFVGIQNPELRFWQYKLPEGEWVPFRWMISRWLETDEVLNFEKSSEDSVRLSVTNMTRKKGNWAMIGLQQIIDLPHLLRVRVRPMFTTPLSMSYPRVTAVEISDQYKRIWVVFTDRIKHQVFFRTPSPGRDLEYAFVFSPVVIGEWNTVTIDIYKVYERMGWQMPEQKDVLREGSQYRIRPVNLLAFVAVYPGGSEGADSIYEAYFDELTNFVSLQETGGLHGFYHNSYVQ